MLSHDSVYITIEIDLFVQVHSVICPSSMIIYCCNLTRLCSHLSAEYLRQCTSTMPVHNLIIKFKYDVFICILLLSKTLVQLALKTFVLISFSDPNFFSRNINFINLICIKFCIQKYKIYWTFYLLPWYRAYTLIKYSKIMLCSHWSKWSLTINKLSICMLLFRYWEMEIANKTSL